jgi:hypothetical protein
LKCCDWSSDVCSSDLYHKDSPNVAMLLQIAQRVKTCGASFLLAPDNIILACAESAISLGLCKEDDKKLHALLKDLPKNERLQSVLKALNK